MNVLKRMPVWILPALLAALPAHAAETPEPSMTMGIFPYMPLARLYQLYQPAAEDIGKAIGYRITIATRNNFAAYRKQLEKARFDIAMIQPFDYPLAARVGYIPVARGSGTLTAVLIVPRDSTITRINQLKGRTLVTPPPRAAVSYLTRHTLLNMNISPGKDLRIIYTRNHFSCMQHILVGKADACGTARQALVHWQKFNLRARLRVIFESKPIPKAVFVVHRRVPVKIRQQIRHTITHWHKRPEGKAILARGPLQPFVPATDQDYDIVRKYLQRIKGRR